MAPECPAARAGVMSCVNDTRACSDGSCEPPLGSTCTATIWVYPDTACAEPSSHMTQVSSLGSKCFDVGEMAIMTPVIVRGKKLENMAYHPGGACEASGAKPVGSAEPLEPATFCCLPYRGRRSPRELTSDQRPSSPWLRRLSRLAANVRRAHRPPSSERYATSTAKPFSLAPSMARQADGETSTRGCGRNSPRRTPTRSLVSTKSVPS